ncbi:hypothetical protein BT96DRAFT_916368 [Gymnopus androsaceus JB14]|uniref:Uncharacterized protein n=1 Tax=Gymnopus androsaceus JB14 TaxID=1447944 RepID=A0A6A4I5K9_9AGAR|nr:hypothetical protein BT96DRAFT_916368 [Gymnopus androsaceus JB14]
MSETQFTIWAFVDVLALYNCNLSPNQFVAQLSNEIFKQYKLEGNTIELWKLACSTTLHPSDNRKERVIASKETNSVPLTPFRRCYHQ